MFIIMKTPRNVDYASLICCVRDIAQTTRWVHELINYDEGLV